MVWVILLRDPSAVSPSCPPTGLGDVATLCPGHHGAWQKGKGMLEGGGRCDTGKWLGVRLSGTAPELVLLVGSGVVPPPATLILRSEALGAEGVLEGGCALLCQRALCDTPVAGLGPRWKDLALKAPSPRGGALLRVLFSVALAISPSFKSACLWHCRLCSMALLPAPMQLLVCFAPSRTRPSHSPPAVRCSWCCVRGPGIWGPACQPCHRIRGHGGRPCLLGVGVLVEGLPLSPLLWPRTAGP